MQPELTDSPCSNPGEEQGTLWTVPATERMPTTEMMPTVYWSSVPEPEVSCKGKKRRPLVDLVIFITCFLSPAIGHLLHVSVTEGLRYPAYPH